MWVRVECVSVESSVGKSSSVNDVVSASRNVGVCAGFSLNAIVFIDVSAGIRKAGIVRTFAGVDEGEYGVKMVPGISVNVSVGVSVGMSTGMNVSMSASMGAVVGVGMGLTGSLTVGGRSFHWYSQ